MLNVVSTLHRVYQQPRLRALIKPLVPSRYRDRLRLWMQPANAVQWCRVVMNQRIERFIGSLDCENIDALEISGTGAKGKYNFRSYRSTTYPDFDVCQGPLGEEEFDLVIAEQVFEHILRPDRAAQHIYQMLRPGGHFVISTPFLLKVHGYPLDLYRWTEAGIRQLLQASGFSVITTGSWGNLECLIADMTPDLEWTSYNPRRHSLHNQPQFPIVVWAFARK